jgi:hypothetical protein
MLAARPPYPSKEIAGAIWPNCVVLILMSNPTLTRHQDENPDTEIENLQHRERQGHMGANQNKNC